MKTLLIGNDTVIRKRSFMVTVSLITAGAVFLSLCNNWWENARAINLRLFSKTQHVQGYSEQAKKTIQNAYEVATITAQMIPADTKNGEVGNYHFLETVEKDESWANILSFRQTSVWEKRSYVESKLQEIKEQREVEETMQAQIKSITCDPTDITKSSNLTLDQLRILVSGTWLEGKEDVLYKADTEGGINAFFCIAISTLESEHGTSPRAKSRNNFYGLETMTDYRSYENCTEYFTDMMHRLYISNAAIGANIKDIGPVYCPPNPEWASIVTDMATTKYNKIMELTEN